MKRWIPLLLILLLPASLSLACSTSLSIPRIETGELQVFTIQEPASTQGVTLVEIQMGSGQLDIAAGGLGLLEGEIRYNVPDWAPELSHFSDHLTLRQERTQAGIPENIVTNDWDLRIGPWPVDLRIEAGAYRGELNLTGLQLANLEISDGTGDARVVFEAPNPLTMDHLRYETGASQVRMTGLGYANFDDMTFSGRAGNYSLDFSGPLQRDARVVISAGFSNLTLTFPENLPVRVEVAGLLNNVSVSGRWLVENGVYTRSGDGPVLEVEVNMSLGNLNLNVE